MPTRGGPRMTRSTKLVIAGALLVSGVGCGIWAWFLAGKTVDVADQWSSVAAGFAALLLGLPSLVIAVLALRNAAPPSPALPGPAAAVPRVGPRGVSVGGSVSAPIVTGDHNRVQG
jgi:hypothetical protein